MEGGSQTTRCHIPENSDLDTAVGTSDLSSKDLKDGWIREEQDTCLLESNTLQYYVKNATIHQLHPERHIVKFRPNITLWGKFNLKVFC
jgi:hypothetical protein